jgi:hypothetical protein
MITGLGDDDGNSSRPHVRVALGSGLVRPTYPSDYWAGWARSDFQCDRRRCLTFVRKAEEPSSILGPVVMRNIVRVDQACGQESILLSATPRPVLQPASSPNPAILNLSRLGFGRPFCLMTGGRNPNTPQQLRAPALVYSYEDVFGVEANLHTELDGGEWSASSLCPFTPREGVPGMDCVAELVGPGASLDAKAKRSLLLQPGI